MPVLRTGSGALGAAAMAMSQHGPLVVKDDEILVDKEGIPHYNGTRPELMKEYKRRVIFAYSMLEGEGDTEEKEQRDLEKRRRRFAKKLMDWLHGEAWQCCQSLLSELPKLQEPEGYKHVLAKLGESERVTVIRKTEQFDKFFERGYRRKGQALDAYLRQRRQDWHDLRELDDQTRMSDDLLAYFILKQCNLSRDDRRQILLSSNSQYNLTEIEKAMRISFYDVHEKEKSTKSSWDNRSSKGYGKQRKGYANFTEDSPEYEHVTEDDDAFEYDETHEYADVTVDDDQTYEAEEQVGEGVSDAGASGDDEIFAAYSSMDKQRRSYRDSRQRLKDLQKSRGFFRGELTFEERKAAVAKEKERTRCSACGRIGHWAGDQACAKTTKSGPKKSIDKGKGKGKSKKAGRAYVVSESPMFFTLGDVDDLPASAYMLSHQDDDEHEMQQDDGLTELDARRKVSHKPEASGAGWSYVSETSQPPMPEDAAPSSTLELPRLKSIPFSEERQMPMVMEEQAAVSVIHVRSLVGVRPELETMSHRELQHECDVWGIRVSGTKSEVFQRLNHFFEGEPVKKKGCSRQCVMLEEQPMGPSASTTLPQPKAKAKSKIERETGQAESSQPKPCVKPESKQMGKKTSGYGYMALDHEVDGSSGSSGQKAFEFLPSDQEDDFRSQRGNFRRDQSLQTQSIEKMPSSHEKIDVAKASPEVPKYDGDFPLKHGQVLPGFPCKVCAGDLVVRQNSRTGKFFFGCARFGQTGCRFTLEYQDGLQLAKRGHPTRQS